MPPYPHSEPGDLRYEFAAANARIAEAAQEAGQPPPAEKLQVWGKDRLVHRAQSRIVSIAVFGERTDRTWQAAEVEGMLMDPFILRRETLMNWLAHSATHWNLTDDFGNELAMDETTIDAIWFDPADAAGCAAYLGYHMWGLGQNPEEAEKKDSTQPGAESASKSLPKASSRTRAATGSSKKSSIVSSSDRKALPSSPKPEDLPINPPDSSSSTATPSPA